MAKKRKVNVKSLLKSKEKGLETLKKRFGDEPVMSCRKDYFEFVCDRYWLYHQALDVAQMRHRHGPGDANEILLEAVELSQRVAAIWAKGNKLQDSECPDGKLFASTGQQWATFPKTVDAIYFRFGTAGVISLIVRKEIHKDILNVVPKLTKWDRSEVVFPLLFPDAGLVHLLTKGKLPRGWKPLLSWIEEAFGSSLLPDTWECYAAIVNNARQEKWQNAVDEVKRAHDLYEMRAEDIYEEFEPWEGSYGSNVLGIDLHLSALMQHCFRTKSKLLDKLDSIHRCAT